VFDPHVVVCCAVTKIAVSALGTPAPEAESVEGVLASEGKIVCAPKKELREMVPHVGAAVSTAAQLPLDQREVQGLYAKRLPLTGVTRSSEEKRASAEVIAASTTAFSAL
jgi:hypothetical protein